METNKKYRNPIIYADVPDLDIIRSKDKEGRQVFYMVSTTMHLTPGVPVMKSYDLVHWKTVNYVYRILEDSDECALRNGKNDYSRGSWAASLRRDPKSGWYLVAFTCNTTQKTYIFMTEDIEQGPWYRNSFDVMCYDNGMLFDESDGRAYIFFSDDCHDEIGTHDICYREMFLDVPNHKITLGDKQFSLHNSNFETPKQGLWGEGFHVYQHNGYTYVFAIQFQHWQRQELCWRTKNLAGKGRWDDEVPGEWTCKKVFVGHLFDENDNVYMKNNGIAQGGIVDTEDGKWYCFLFEDSGAVGRIPMLSPMTWGTEGEMKDWPVIGRYLGEETPYLFQKMPVTAGVPVELPEGDLSEMFMVNCETDDFDNDESNRRVFDSEDLGNDRGNDGENAPNGSYLNLMWQWNHNPDNRRWSLTERPGFLRLRPVGTAKNIREARNMLSVRALGPTYTASVRMDTEGMTEGMCAGVSAYQRRYGFVGVTVENGEKYIVMRKADSKEDADGRVVARERLTEGEIRLRITFDFTDRKDEAMFYWSLDGENWKQIGEKMPMFYDMPDFMGYRFGLVAFADRETDGYADFDRFEGRV